MSNEPLDYKIWDDRQNGRSLVWMGVALVVNLLVPIFFFNFHYPSSFLLSIVLWVVYSGITWLVLAIVFAPSGKEAYETYLKEHYRQQGVSDAAAAKSQASLDKQELEAKEAQLLKELYALRHTSQDSGSLDERLKNLENELDKEKKITALEAELKSETAMRNKYKEMALNVKKPLH